MCASTPFPTDVYAEQTQKITPRHGVVTVSGYGSSIRVDRGHLIIEDGIGAMRRSARFARVGHGLKRIVVIGSDGMVSLSALRWLADQEAAFVLLDRIGKVVATTGPVAPSDARLRRAQALAHQSGIALPIARELVAQKIIGQERVLAKYFPCASAFQILPNARTKLEKASSSDDIRLWEAKAAKAYWGGWYDLPVSFPRSDLPGVPDHWKTFGNRVSPITSSPRLAVNPANAMLNYLYALLESEARLALAALGLDPGLGVLHNDLRTRDSLACDLMEPIRPQADAFLLDWLNRTPLRREWFFEERNGNCRLMSSLTAKLSETTSIWARALAPFAEGIARSFWTLNSERVRTKILATRLTQSTKRKAKGVFIQKSPKPTARALTVCKVCGDSIKLGNKYCINCVPRVSRENLLEVAKRGRIATHTPEAESLRSQTQKRQMAARKAWNPKDKPDWLDKTVYKLRIQSNLKAITVSAIMRTLDISAPYATVIRSGKHIPHQRHWMTLARLIGADDPEN